MWSDSWVTDDGLEVLFLGLSLKLLRFLQQQQSVFVRMCFLSFVATVIPVGRGGAGASLRFCGVGGLFRGPKRCILHD